MVAALVVTIEELQAGVADLKQEVTDSIAKPLLDAVWDHVETSRQLSRGHFAGQCRARRSPAHWT